MSAAKTGMTFMLDISNMTSCRHLPGSVVAVDAQPVYKQESDMHALAEWSMPGSSC